MADSSTYLKEYLIQVGVTADTNTLSKFATIVGNIEKLVTSLTGAIATGIVAIEGLVTVTANELDDLYWATKRLKSSASDIQDFQLRMSKAGESAQDARDSLETLEAFRRTNPFGNSMLGLFGVNAQGKGTVQTMDALIVRFKQLNAQGQYWLAVKWGEQLGLTEKQVWSMVQTTAKSENVYANMYKRMGINQKKAMEDAHAYTNKLKDFEAQLKVTSQTLGLKFLPLASKFLDWLTTSDAANNMGKALLMIAQDLADIADGASRVLGVMPKEATEMGIIGFLLFGRKGALVMAMIGAATSLLDKVSGDKERINEAKIKQYGESPWYAAARFSYDHGFGIGNTNEFNKTYAEYLYRKEHPEKKAGPVTPEDYATPGSDMDQLSNRPGRGRNALGVRSNNPLNLQPGGKEATFPSAMAGMVAGARNLLRYHRNGLVTIESIISKWAPALSAAGVPINNTAAYIARVSKAMGMKSNAYLNLNDPAVLQRLMSAMVSVEQGYNPYSDQMTSAAAKAALGTRDGRGVASRALNGNAPATPLKSVPLGGGAGTSKNVTIHQTNNTTINNAKDPVGTGAQMKKTADRSNGDLVRNMSTALI